MAIDRTINDPESRLNDLYWSSSRTIDEIVEELAVGRSALYAAIRPLSTGIACTTCGDDVVFTNRTSRAAGTGSCIACGFEMAVAAGMIEDDRDRGASQLGEKPDGRRGWDRWREDLTGVAPERAALIGGGAALGVMLGAAAVRALRH